MKKEKNSTKENLIAAFKKAVRENDINDILVSYYEASVKLNDDYIIVKVEVEWRTGRLWGDHIEYKSLQYNLDTQTYQKLYKLAKDRIEQLKQKNINKKFLDDKFEIKNYLK